MINLNQLLDQLQPTPDAPGKPSAGLEAPQKESFLFSDVLGEAQKGDEKSAVLDLEGGPLSLEDWAESSLLELSQEQQEALLAALFTLEEGLTAQIGPGDMMEKAQAKVDAFWSALEGLLEEWKVLMAQGDLLSRQLSQPLEAEVRQGIVERLDHLSKLESEGIWNQIIHWIGRFMERDQGENVPSAFSPVELSNSEVDQSIGRDFVENEEPVATQEEDTDLSTQAQQGEAFRPEGEDLATVSPIPVFAGETIKSEEGPSKDPLSRPVDAQPKTSDLSEENLLTSLDKENSVKEGSEKNLALQQKILKALEAVARRRSGSVEGPSSSQGALEGIEVKQGDPDNMWGRIRRWLADRVVQESITKSNSGELATKAPENLSKGGAVEFLKFVATLQRKGFGQATGFEANMAPSDDLENQVSPEVRRRLPLPIPPVVRQASYGLPGQDPSSALLQYAEKGFTELAREALPSDGVKPTHEGVSGNRETQDGQGGSEKRGEATTTTRDSSRWDPSVLQNFVRSTRAQFQLWADRKFVAMQVQLEPEALGRMQLKTILENGRIGVLVQVEQHAARELLNNHLDHLKSLLEERGLEVAAFHVEVRQQQTGGGQGFYGPKKHGPRFDLEALMQDSEGELQVESPILRGLINKVA